MSDAEIILVTGSHGEHDRKRIMAAAQGRQVEFVASTAARPDLLAKARVLAGTLRGLAPDRAPRLAWVHSWLAGVDSELTPELAAGPIVLTSSAGNGAIPLAEHAMLLMLMLNRDARRWMRAQTDHQWDRFEHGELNGLTCGILGLGNSGADLAGKAKAFHMRVIGVRRRAETAVPFVDELYGPDRLHEFLAEADFVVVTAPLTPDTTKLLGEPEFRAMKPSSHVICYSRGGIIDDEALLTALREGWIAGAGLDAHGIEPLPRHSPFWDLENVIITPHNGATTAATRRRGVDIFVDNLGRFLAGEPLTNVVDKSLGY
jgi:phosphoglycerate dehydrogenase-like enzyme